MIVNKGSWLTRHLIRMLTLVLLTFSGFALAQDDAPAEPGSGSPTGATTYINLQPAFVVNYGGVGRLRFLRAEVSLRVEQGGEPAVMHHMPYIRHKIIMLLSRQTDDAVSTTEGKELLRIEALEEVRTALMAEEGDHMLRDLLFSSFVIQR